MGRGTGAAIRLVLGGILAVGAAEVGVLLAEGAHRTGQTDILVSLLGVGVCFFILLCLLSRRRAV
jgi:uncharacterized membrane protein